MRPALATLLRIAALAALFATTFPVRNSHAGSWTPSLRVTGGTGSWYEEPFHQIGLAGHVVHDGSYIRPGLEGGWWEQLGHFGLTSVADNGVYAENVRFTNFLMGAIVQVAPAGRRAPVYLVLGVSDLVAVSRYEFFDAHTRSEWGHAPAVSGGIGIAASDRFSPVVEARWYRRRTDTDRMVPNHYFHISAGVRF